LLHQKSVNHFIFYTLLTFYPAISTGIAPFSLAYKQETHGITLSLVGCLSAFTMQADREN
jgi:hypothetical protein